jgi:hypothetical protein
MKAIRHPEPLRVSTTPEKKMKWKQPVTGKDEVKAILYQGLA